MQSDQTTTASSRRIFNFIALLLVILAAVAIVTGIMSRAHSDEKLKQWTAAQAIPSVSVVQPANDGAISTLDLPGRFEAYARAPIYARVSGYLKSWKVDIGAPVKAGQLLGEIETPDIDQQLLQAQADLASAQANAELAATTAKRWQGLLASEAVSRQEVDDRTSDFATKQAMVKAAQANVDRLLATKNFARIVAPFDGVVTARDTDVGALINAGGSSGGPALFEISDTRRLRLYVNVPQSYVASIKLGTKADITVPEHADKTYTATVESSSRSVDVASGTTLVQLAVDNAAGELLAGSFANVSLHLPKNTQALSIPSSALIFDQSGLSVATVGADNKVLIKPVTVARDLGKRIELGSGVGVQDRIIESPPDGIANGAMVKIVEGAKPKKADS
jgi:RND family efflux transporter MFP subunit